MLRRPPRSHRPATLVPSTTLFRSHVTGNREAVLLHARQVGVTRARRSERVLDANGTGRHLLLPLGPLEVGDLDDQRRAEGRAMPHASEQQKLVTHEALTWTTSEAQAAPCKLIGDAGPRHTEPSRHPL